MRRFTGIDFLKDSVPDETTLCNFRHLLEEHGLNKLFFDAINRVMVATGHIMRGGTIVDAAIIDAPSSTKNEEKKGDPEMNSTKKGNQWRFGMKCHVGVDAETGYVQTIEVTPANIHDVTMVSELIREDDKVLYGDSAYLGIERREEAAQDGHLSSVDYRISLRPGRFPKVSGNAADVGDRLDKGLLDFGIMMGLQDLKKYDCVKFPGVDVWGVLMPGGHPLSKKK